MSGSYHDTDWTAKVTVPVKRVGERWEFLYGGDVPVREGTFGQLSVSPYRITDKNFLKRLTQEFTTKILDEGTRLMVALSDRSEEWLRRRERFEPFPDKAPPGTTRFEPVTLGPLRKRWAWHRRDEGADDRGGLWLKLKGLDRCELLGSAVLMPQGFDPPEAYSLNHAFTMLSKAHEAHRISNTGNVYTRFFYQERDGLWYPLDDLRTGMQAQGERRLVNDLWAGIEQVLGWRPVPVPAGKRAG